MKYVRLDREAIVREIIPDFDPRFPEIPIDQRYSKEFLSQCLELDDAVEVEQNWEYLPLENVFLPQVEYMGASFAEAELGQAVDVAVNFSEPGAWVAAGAAGIELAQTENILTITAREPGEWHIGIDFREAGHGRAKPATITVAVAEPAPQNGPVEITENSSGGGGR